MAREPFAALLTTIWIGGLFFWLMKGFKGKLDDELTELKKKRNMATGYIIQVIGLIGALYIIL